MRDNTGNKTSEGLEDDRHWRAWEAEWGRRLVGAASRAPLALASTNPEPTIVWTDSGTGKV